MYTATKEHPALFNAAMVRALREGRKTQTRRIVKGAPTNPEAYLLGVYDGVWGIHADVEKDDGVWRGRCPYGVPGDRLWVREKFAYLERDAAVLCNLRVERRYGVVHGQDLASVYCTDAARLGWDGPWKPSIHMPRWASRITLEITSLRVERLQGITEEDAIAEGVLWDVSATIRPPYTGPRAEFAQLWGSIHGPDSWRSNPFVWVVEFKRIGEVNHD